MVQQTSVHNCAPNFSDEAVQRYPSLTLALGDNYPGRPIADIPQYHASESFYSDHDAPMSFNGMPSSLSSPMSPFGSSTRSEQRSMPGASINHMIGSPRNIPTFHEVPITICPDMISGDSPEIPAVSPTWSSSSDDFIPICNTSPSIPLEEDKNPRSCAHTISRDGLPLPLRRAKRIKTYECDRCDMVFPRSSDLRTHQNVHAGEERFTCEFPNCKKKFGVRANLLRHSAMHQIPKTISDRSTPRVKFATPEKVPHVHSDTVPMRAGIVWDNEGPLARRQAQWSGTLMVPQQRNPNTFDNI